MVYLENTQEVLEEGLIIYFAWQANKNHNISDLKLLELAVRNSLIKKHFRILPLRRKRKKCGSYEYIYSRYKCERILNKNTHLNHKSFDEVLFYSPLESIETLVKDGIDKARIRIKNFRKQCSDKYINQIPEHEKCKLNESQKCLCPQIRIKTSSIVRTEKIGFGVNPTTKIPKIKYSEIKKDKHTSLHRRSDNHILYIPGWSLKNKDS